MVILIVVIWIILCALFLAFFVVIKKRDAELPVYRSREEHQKLLDNLFKKQPKNTTQVRFLKAGKGWTS